MKTFFKPLSLLLVMMLLTSLFVGCAKEEPSATTETDKPAATTETKQNTETPAPVETPAEKEPVTITFYSWESYNEAANQRVIDAFQEMYPYITVKAEYVGEGNSTEYVKKMDIQQLSGEQVDVVMQPGLDKHVERAGKDLLEPLDSYMEAEGIKYDDVYTLPIQVNGTTYALPGDLKSWFVMINKDHLDEAGLPVPPLDWTWDDYREYAKALTQGEGQDKRYGSYFHNWPQYSFLALNAEKENTAFYKEEGVLNFDDPLFRAFLQFRYDLENVAMSKVPYVDVLSQKLAYRDVFFNEKASMVPTGGWMISEIGSDAYPHDFVTTFAPLPRFNADAAPGMTDTACHFYAVSKTSEYKEEAYLFIRFMTTKGMELKGSSLTAEKGADFEAVLSKIIEGKEKYYDTQALFNVYKNPDWKDNIASIIPLYHKQIEDIYKEETEKFLIGGQDLNITFENIKGRAQQVIDDAN